MAKHKCWQMTEMLLLLIILVQGTHAIFEFEVLNSEQSMSVRNGKKQMEELRQHARLPIGNGPSGDCWKAALVDLEIGCKFLSEEVQSRLALRFTSCFNMMFGLETYICEGSAPIQDCMKQLSSDDRGTFKDYFLHTQDMCYYLRQEIWQEQTNDAVTRLTETAADVTSQMFEQKEIQDQIYQSQQQSLLMQSNIVRDNEGLYDAVVKVKDVFDDFSVTTREHQLITSEIFEKLSRMQRLVSWIQGEMSLFDAVFSYAGAIVVGVFATSPSRTKAARFWLVLLLIGTMWTESAFHKYVHDYDAEIQPEDVQWFAWMIRKISAAIGFVILLVAAALYRDPQDIHNTMMANMKLTLERVSKYIQDEVAKRSVEEKKTEYDGATSSDEDSFENYSTDNSDDDLDNELKDLSDDNTENVAPTSVAAPPRYFGKETTDGNVVSPLASESPVRRYNLRERSRTPVANPVVLQESVTQFARLIKRRKAPAPKPSNGTISAAPRKSKNTR